MAVIFFAAAGEGCGRRHHASEITAEEGPPAERPALPARFLTYSQLERLRIVQKSLRPIIPREIGAWADEVRGSENPEAALRLWEARATAFDTFTAYKPLSIESKREVFRVIQFRERMSEEEVLQKLRLVTLTEADAKEIMGYFVAASDPPQ
jgi:hypothetical protein